MDSWFLVKVGYASWQWPLAISLCMAQVQIRLAGPNAYSSLNCKCLLRDQTNSLHHRQLLDSVWDPGVINVAVQVVDWGFPRARTRAFSRKFVCLAAGWGVGATS